ncbi:MAG: vWA domain-containing protein [Spirochaetia bacterium]
MRKTPKKQFLGSFFCVFFLLFLGHNLAADTREENIDLFIVLDKSLSMEEEIGAVKDYVQDSLVREVLIPGDFIAVIQFYGQAELLFAETVQSDEEIEEYLAAIEEIEADGSFTDIGNALDVLRDSLEQYHRKDRREYLLLLTDGKQEAPSDSKYYTEDGSFNHAFLENARTIQKAGWKIQVLGIGPASAAREIAEELAGGYAETSEEPTKEELAEKTQDLLAVLELTGALSVKPASPRGESAMTFQLQAVGFTDDPVVAVERITVTLEKSGNEYLVAEDVTLTPASNGVTDVSIPISFPQMPGPGSYEARVRFVFGGLEVFTPGVVSTEVEFRGFFGSNLFWIIPVAVIFLAGIGLGLFFLLRGAGRKRPMKVRVFIDNKAVGTGPFLLKPDDKLYVVPEKAVFTVVDENKPDAVAVVSRKGDALVMTILEEKSLKTADPLPMNILGEKVRLKLHSGLYITFLFKVV